MKDEQPEVPLASFASADYPQLPDHQKTKETRTFEVMIKSVAVDTDENGEVFPWQASHGWWPDQRKDFVVPCHEEPRTDGSTILVVTGLSGKQNWSFSGNFSSMPF